MGDAEGEAVALHDAVAIMLDVAVPLGVCELLGVATGEGLEDCVRVVV